MPGALKEVQAINAISPSVNVTTLTAARATPTAVVKHLRHHRFAHLVCHGILEPGWPLDASFKLHNGQRLTLLDIVRSRLPDAEFAFLSACQTAELTDESIADKPLHLAAAMQYCGFRSVVGTMWAMADVDGRDIAESFYGSVFSDARDGLGRGARRSESEFESRSRSTYCERTAEALRDAVKQLRKKTGITLERWVNFVHYGA
jgi:CHAT domain-containing protein